MGLARALSRRPMLVVDRAGLRAGRRTIPWAEVLSWEVRPTERRIVLSLAHPPGGGMLRGRGSLRFDARLIDARLTDLVRAFRDIRPDLETPA